jgi:hypothetical protein
VSTDSITDPVYVQTNPRVNGIGDVICVPGSNQSIFHTLGDNAVFIAEDAKDGDHSAYPVLVSDELDSGGYLSHGLARNGLAILPRRNGDGIPIFESFIEDSAGPGAINLWLTFEKVRGVGVGTEPRAVIGYREQPVGVPGPFVELDIPWDGSAGRISVDLPVGGSINAFYLQVTDNDPSAKWTFSMGTRDPSNFAIRWILPESSATAYKIVNPRDLQGLERTTEERPTALTLLSSFVGTTFANGGLVAGARLPIGMSLASAPDGDNFSFLASLPIYSDDNPVKNGQYTWWCPDSMTEYFYSPYGAPKSGSLTNTSMIVQTFTRDDPNQDIRISVVTGIEVLTRSNLYAASVGPVNPMFSKILQFAKLLPASTENPTHKQILAKAFRTVKANVLKPANWLRFGKGVLDMFK